MLKELKALVNRKAKILVVDDLRTRRMLNPHLATSDYRVTTPNGAEARQVFSPEAPDLVVTERMTS